MSFRIEHGHIIQTPNSSVKKQVNNSNLQFQRIFQETLNRNDSNIKISAHAEQRMQERNIKLEESDINALKDAMNDLEKKGARESLMLYKDMAFIASIKNRTIITTMNNNEMDVVTNIDSAIIVK
ncbi:TIGR02530 family flagellar biosynthesis protein [Tissierella sp. Yu-01]|uniref:TIGR02530 family flagellar biosynthesis protein n=1 Tax=Tissierella sp. Yu-01 TaxID=3035694 RepID=UPI00240D5892|nr:TIGR02530 family flagellar biosynthesis protein [Tissierella sp. Yu-01]WFA07894.1 TIGR02530 family flagellar biosynthesis protein [Tissierella sp. Yu-01]